MCGDFGAEQLRTNKHPPTTLHNRITIFFEIDTHYNYLDKLKKYHFFLNSLQDWGQAWTLFTGALGVYKCTIMTGITIIH